MIWLPKKKGLLQNDATASKTMEILHPQDVGAAIGRPRATNRRPYEFYRKIFVFCNSPFCVKQTDKMKEPRLGWPDQTGALSEKKRGKKMKKNENLYLLILYPRGIKK